MIVTDDNMAANMYRVGDYVYFETSSTSPYQIRRIEELNKTQNGNVEAKVMCFYRRRDLPNPLIMLADRHQMNSASADDTPISAKLKKILIKAPSLSGVLAVESGGNEGDAGSGGGGIGGGGGGGGGNVGCLADGGGTPEDDLEGRDKDNGLSWRQRHQLKHRELFLSRQVETLPATHIRGKCSVTLLNETESFLSYLNKDDTFFYCLVFDPTQKTLLADKGEIRVGSRYQADATALLKQGEADSRNSEDLETLVWTPSHNLTDRQIDQFLVISRSVGTFARALDCSSSVKQPSLHMSAAAASRDVTLFHAMDTLHNYGYNMSEAISRLVPSSGPVLCRDEMEEWSASEANLFEEALEKYGKDFNDIRKDFLPWKTLKNIIEYYYMWKTTDRYVQQKRVKAVEAESKLKQVYIPNYNKPNPAVINNNKGVLNGSAGDDTVGGKSCESCQATHSSQWYAWGPSHMQYKLCHACWSYWKKYGGLKNPSKLNEAEADARKKSGSASDEERGLASHRPHQCSVASCGKIFKLKAHLARHYATAHGMVLRAGAGSPRPIMKTRTAFYLHTSPLTRLARRLCRHLLQARHAARSPFWSVNVPALKQECQTQTLGKTPQELKEMLKVKKKERGSVTQIANRLGDPEVVPDWLLPTDKNLIPKTACIMFPKPPKGPDGSLLYERVPNKPEAEKSVFNNISPSLKRRAYDENGLEDLDWDEGLVVPQPGPPAKRPSKEVAAMRAAAAAEAALQAVATGANTTGCLAVTAQVAPAPRPVSSLTHLNGQGRPKIATMTRTGTGRKGVISWMDAPDDVYFRSTLASRKLRRQLSAQELRRASRKPWRKVTGKALDDMVMLD